MVACLPRTAPLAVALQRAGQGWALGPTGPPDHVDIVAVVPLDGGDELRRTMVTVAPEVQSARAWPSAFPTCARSFATRTSVREPLATLATLFADLGVDHDVADGGGGAAPGGGSAGGAKGMAHDIARRRRVRGPVALRPAARAGKAAEEAFGEALAMFGYV